MLKKLSDKDLVSYQKYQGVTLTENGFRSAKMIVRKHRLWEVFLVEKLGFAWDEVHDIAEELEHIKSETLINKLDEYLHFPSFDPHGDPIPDVNGVMKKVNKLLLSEVELHKEYQCVGVKHSSSEFLQYLDKQKIALGSKIVVKEKESFDDTLLVEVNSKEITISNKIANNLYVH
jgi:DtxR family Mn-dependent transcriptional regulator